MKAEIAELISRQLLIHHSGEKHELLEGATIPFIAVTGKKEPAVWTK